MSKEPSIVLDDVAAAAFLRVHGHELRRLEGDHSRVLFIFDRDAQPTLEAFDAGAPAPAKDYAGEVRRLFRAVKLRREQRALDKDLLRREPVAAAGGCR